MHLHALVVSFSYEEQRQFKQLIDYYRLGKEVSKQRSEAERFKHILLTHIIEIKNQLAGKKSVIQEIKRLLREKRLLGQSMSIASDQKQISGALKQFKKFMRQKQRDSDSYNLYVTLLGQLRELNQQNFSQFQANIRKMSALTFDESQNIKFLAKNIIKSNQAEQALKAYQNVSEFIAEITDYGFFRQIKSLEKIQDEKLLKKCKALVQKMANNYIEIQSHYHFTQNCFKQFIRKMSTNIYPSQQVMKSFKKLAPKLQSILDPLVKQVFSLRQRHQQQKFRPTYIRGNFHDSQLKKVEEESLQQLVADYSLASSKLEKCQTELSKMAWFIKAVSSISPNLKQKSIHDQIVHYIQNHEVQEAKFSLLKIYQKFNNYLHKEPISKSVKQSVEDFQYNEKLTKKISILQDEVQRHKHSVSQLQEDKQQLLKQIRKLERVIRSFQQKQDKEKSPLIIIKDLELTKKQTSLKLLNQKKTNQDLNQKLNTLQRQKQQMQQQLKLIKNRLLLKSQSAQQVNRNDSRDCKQCEKLKQKQRQLQQQKTQLKNQVRKLQSEVGLLRQHFQDQKSKNIQLQHDLSKLLDQKKVLANNYQQMMQQKQSIPRLRKIQDDEKSNLASQVAQLRSVIQNLTKSQLQANKRQTRLKEEIISAKDNQEKVKQSYRKLYEHFISLRDKNTALKKENDDIKHQRLQQNTRTVNSQPQLREDSQVKYNQVLQTYTSYKKSTEKELREKQEQIANLKLQLIQLQRRSQNNPDLHQQQIRKEKLEYLETTLAQLEEQNSRMKIELQRKEQQILILKTQQLK